MFYLLTAMGVYLNKYTHKCLSTIPLTNFSCQIQETTYNINAFNILITLVNMMTLYIHLLIIKPLFEQCTHF